jgi:hypothetical protein
MVASSVLPTDTTWGMIFDFAFSFVIELISAVFLLGMIHYTLNICKEQPYKLSDVFYGFKSHPDKAIICQFLFTLAELVCMLPAILFAILYTITENPAFMIVMSVFLVIGLVAVVILHLTLHFVFYLILDYPDATIYGVGCTTICGDEIPNVITGTAARGVLENPWVNYPSCLTGSSTTARREKLIEVGLFDTRMTHGEDIDMWWRLLLSGKGVVDNRVMAFYRQDTENRAMNKVIPLEKHIPYYINKYAEARANNVDFRTYFDREMIYRLYPYLFDARYKKTAQKLAKQMDYRLQKWTMRFRMEFPYLYRLYEILKITKSTLI